MKLGLSRSSGAYRRASIFACFALLTTFVVVSSSYAADRMLVVSWDGAARRVVRELLHWQAAAEPAKACPTERFGAVMPMLCGEQWTCLPNLCRFEVIDSWDSTGKPLTRPQHAQMLSGYGPDTTGVVSNNGSASMPEGYTLYERLKAARGPGLKTVHIAGLKYVSRGVTAKAQRNGSIDVFARRGGPDGRTGVNTTRRALPIIDAVAQGPFFMFVHYKEADVTAHLRGVDSVAYREALMLIDKELGVLLAELDAKGAMPTTSVLVTTDHGFTGRFHVSREVTNTDTWIASLNLDLRADRYAKLLDVTPTIYDYFGVSVDDFDPPLEGRSLLIPLGTSSIATTTTTTTTQGATSTTLP